MNFVHSLLFMFFMVPFFIRSVSFYEQAYAGKDLLALVVYSFYAKDVKYCRKRGGASGDEKTK